MGLRDQSRLDKKNRILEAAARVFARRGYSGAVMADIAEEAGIGKGTLYEYFDSKEELFFGVFGWFMGMMLELSRVETSVLGASASEKILAIMESLIRITGEEMNEMMTLFMEFWAASGASRMQERFKQAFRETYTGFRKIFAALIREGMERGEFRSDADPESLAAVLVGSWDGLFLQAWFEPSFDVEKVLKDFLETLFKGLMQKPKQTMEPEEG
ncbi:MAG: TetR/AcrR family transcriptional regulator [Deltaproteobacteria bacterium]|nr:TetR/AcrR family transcriptional regulator [Deltaproteobacteria bacterium]MBW2304223.1 TetR/AcrR family transcriptional regulator [Deltaproteobacteria bacterium]